MQREVEFSSTELSMMWKGPKQKYVEFQPVTFQNYDPINAQIDNTGIICVVLQPTSTLHSVVYTISEANSSTPFNLLIQFKQNR